MARGRMINTKIAEDIDFNEMSVDAQFLFMRAIPFLDRDGLITGHPTLLWSKIAPLLPQYAAAMTRIVDEWIEAGFVIKYMDGKTPVLFFRGFHKNQALMHYEREGASAFAPPPGYHRTPKGLKPLDSDDGGEITPPNEPKNNPPSDTSVSEDEVNRESGLTPDELRIESARERGMEVEVKEKLKEKTTTTVIAQPAVEPKPQPEIKNGGSGGGVLPSLRNRQSDQDYARLCQKFESNGFGTLTQIMAEEINALMNEHPSDWIDDAMTVSVEANKRQLRYVRGILVKWRAQGRSDKQPSSAQSPQVKPILPLKKWCFQHYGTEFPQFVTNVPETVIKAQYEQYRAQYQQAH